MKQKAPLALALLAVVCLLPACAVLDRAYQQELATTSEEQITIRTNTLTVTNLVSVPVYSTNYTSSTNADGAVLVTAAVSAVGTSLVPQVSTSQVPVYVTNTVTSTRTNLLASPAAETLIESTGGIINMFMPGIGSIVALALGGAYHGYRQVRNKKINEALIQGVETARAVLTTTPQGQAADQQFVKWLAAHQKTAGVFLTVSQLVDKLTDTPAALVTAQEIRSRVQQAQVSASTKTTTQQPSPPQDHTATVLGPSCVGPGCQI